MDETRLADGAAAIFNACSFFYFRDPFALTIPAGLFLFIGCSLSILRLFGLKMLACGVASDRVTLGVRDFTRKGIPFRCRLGNVLTSFLVRCLFGMRICDTQTGLRAIPRRLFDMMLETQGERYEYEMHLFGMLKERAESFEQVPIQTIYLENNRTSHFRPIRDSIRVYRALLGNGVKGHSVSQCMI